MKMIFEAANSASDATPTDCLQVEALGTGRYVLDDGVWFTAVCGGTDPDEADCVKLSPESVRGLVAALIAVGFGP